MLLKLLPAVVFQAFRRTILKQTPSVLTHTHTQLVAADRS